MGRMSGMIVSVEAASTGARRPNCARCRNHYEIVPLKGHKNYCKFKKCKCVKCLLTQERQNVMAKQTAQRRRQQLDEDRLKKGLPVPPSPPPETSQQWSEVITPAPSPPPVSVPTTSNSSNNSSSSTSSESVRLESIVMLMEMFQYQPDMPALLYIILRDITPDITEAYRRILDAQVELRAERGRHPLWSIYYPPQSPTATTVYKPHSTTLGMPLPWALSPYRYPQHPYFVASSPYTRALKGVTNAKDLPLV
ncbi:uncharacterized protein LOC142325419 [Lycorma delicatula]|uniref:uncharacterized protein LOC142325419 n=1 Tax=Lycorma delicatula TaxID=130591 RepID=UPI003F516639